MILQVISIKKICIKKKLKYHRYKAVAKTIKKAGTLFIVDYYASTYASNPELFTRILLLQMTWAYWTLIFLVPAITKSNTREVSDFCE